MDEIAEFNKARWEELAQAHVEFSRPMLDLNPETARQFLDPNGVMGEMAGKRVLCLACGGGQQSVAFALLGADVTIFDLSETQLERDRQAAAHYQLSIQIEQGDMRDLSRFANDSFDLVYHAFSINFIPDARPVFAEVVRVLRPGGLYRVQYFNPFIQAMDDENWDEQGYRLKHPYTDGADMSEIFPNWDVDDETGNSQKITSPKEFRHRLSTMVNGLIGQGFVLLGVWEVMNTEPDPEPGSWEHFMSVAPPYLTFWARYQPEVFNQPKI